MYLINCILIKPKVASLFDSIFPQAKRLQIERMNLAYNTVS